METAIIRPATLADTHALARVHVESWRTTYPGIVPDDIIAHLSVERSEGHWRDDLGPEHPEFVTFAAENAASEVGGFAIGGPRRDGPAEYTGELYGLYLLKDWQGQGLGRRLTAATATELARRGMRSMLVWVLAENHPARRFYEALGGQYVASQPIKIRVMLEEVAYGWPDTASLKAKG